MPIIDRSTNTAMKRIALELIMPMLILFLYFLVKSHNFSPKITKIICKQEEKAKINFIFLELVRTQLINSFTVKNVYETEATNSTQTFTNLQNLIEENNLPVTDITYGVTIPADSSVSITFSNQNIL